MKAKLNKATGMIALVASKGIMNRKKGTVFGSLPKDAGRLIAGKYASIYEEKLPDGDYSDVDINVDNGAVEVKGMKSKNASGDKKVTQLQAKLDEQSKTSDNQAKEIEDLKKQIADNADGTAKAAAGGGNPPAVTK